jgi:ribokinase
VTFTGLGLINADFVAVVPAWERDEKVRAVHYFEQVGGPVPVALQTIARLGDDACAFLGVVGDDRIGDDLGRALTESGVTPHLQRAAAVATSRSLVLVDARDAARTVANYAEALPGRTLSAADEALLAGSPFLHIDGRDLSACRRAAESVRAAGGRVSLDLGTMRLGTETLFPLCDIVVASKKGAAGAFPQVADDPIAQVLGFLERGVTVAGVTLAEEGIVVGDQSGALWHLPAFPVAAPVDTCGAGDVFHGAFLWAFAQGRPLEEAAQLAQAAAALRIGAYGNAAGIPTRDALERFVQENTR